MKHFLLLSCACVVLLGASSAFAKSDCRGFVLKGKVSEIVKSYDSWVIALAKEKKPGPKVAERLAKEGLPFPLLVKKKPVSGVESWLEVEDISGNPMAEVFLKKLMIPGGKGQSLHFDGAYLFTDAKAKKTEHEWNVPYNSFYPKGLEGDELIFERSFHPFCREGDSVEITLAVKPDGSLRVVDWPKAEELGEVKDCPAKKLFKKSDYGICSRITDRKTKKKKILAWEEPMT